MKPSALILGAALSFFLLGRSVAQETTEAPPRHMTLEEAVDLALKHNHALRIAGFKVEEKEHTKEAARGAYFPILRNDSVALHVTDTQFIGIPAGGLGIAAGTPIPARSVILNQGGQTFVTSGTSLTQPITQLLKIKSANDIASAELRSTRDKKQQLENTVVLKIHHLFYRLLIAQTHRQATEVKIKATEELQKERLEQVKYGSSLEEEAIESRAQTLEAKQDLLSTDLQLSDLTMQLNDVIGLPLTTRLELESTVKQVGATCEREECLRAARESHPEIAEARTEVEKASAALRLSKREYLPDLEAFARYSYQNNVPFLARNFGTFGVHLGFDIFDGGKKRAVIGERQSQLAQAKENLARVTEEVELRVQTAFNKLERTRQMVKVSEELLALRSEAHRVSAQQLEQGAVLRSQVGAASARELDAKTLLLQSQLDYVEARDEMSEAMGTRPD